MAHSFNKTKQKTRWRDRIRTWCKDGVDECCCPASKSNWVRRADTRHS